MALTVKHNTLTTESGTTPPIGAAEWDEAHEITGALSPRISSTTSVAGTFAWNSDNFDQYAATAQSTGSTISADSGTPTDGQKMIFRFLDNGTSRNFVFTGGVSKGFRTVGVTLTTSGVDFTYNTVPNKTVYFGMVYNGAAARWDIIAISEQG